MMSMRLKGLLAALLLAVAPVSMAVTTDATLNVTIGGAPVTFADYIGSDGDFNYLVNLIGSQGTTSSTSVSFNSGFSEMELQDANGNVLATGTPWGPVVGASPNTGYGFTLSHFLTAGAYILHLSGDPEVAFSGSISAVPLPGAAVLFGSALFGAGVFSRRRTAARDAEAIVA